MKDETTIKDAVQEVISNKRYLFLKGFKNLSDQEKKQVADFERAYVEKEKQNIVSQKDYWNKVFSEKKDEFKLDAKTLFNAFLKKYKILEGKEFELNDNSKANLKTLVYYFTLDPRFFNSPILEKISKPSFDKGLLIIGGFGNGKSKTMNCFHKLFNRTPLSFGLYDANELIDKYESCNTPLEKENFWKLMGKGLRFYDDVKTERMASNYGKTNLFKDIFEKRYSLKSKTYIACNYKEGVEGDVNAAIKEFGEKYGGRVYDRIFEMFNVIHFKGKSFRK